MVGTGEIKYPVWNKTSTLPCGEGGPAKARGRNPDRKSACSEA